MHEGNVADSPTLLPEVKRLRQDFGIDQLVLVGDRGMISQKVIAELRESDGIAWITALKSASIRARQGPYRRRGPQVQRAYGGSPRCGG